MNKEQLIAIIKAKIEQDARLISYAKEKNEAKAIIRYNGEIAAYCDMLTMLIDNNYASEQETDYLD